MDAHDGRNDPVDSLRTNISRKGNRGLSSDPVDDMPTIRRGDTPTDMRNAGLSEKVKRELKDLERELGQVVAGRFEILDRLGYGGMGAVYKVSDRSMPGEVRALKVMLPSLVKDDVLRKAFVEEVRLAKDVRDPNVVAVYDLGEHNDIQFFTMEYVDGMSLANHIREHGGKLSVQDTLAIAARISAGLAAAHESKAVHRDLKPHNVMITPGGKIKILDFGLATLMDPDERLQSKLDGGTAYYEAPEQRERKDVIDARVDIYSLGVMMYEMLTGSIPTGRAKAASHHNPEIPDALDDLLDRMLEMEPNDRMSSMNEVQRVVESIMKGDFEDGGSEPAGKVALDDVVDARMAAKASQSDADKVDAASLMPDLYQEAETAFKRGDTLTEMKRFKDSVDKFVAATELFRRAEFESERVTREQEELEDTAAAMDTAKSKAVAADAPELAHILFARAEDRRAKADKADSPVTEAELCAEAKRIYLEALAEAEARTAELENQRQDLEAAKRAMNAARSQAMATHAPQHAGDLFADAEEGRDLAEKERDHAKAGRIFRRAETLYLEAYSVAEKAILEIKQQRLSEEEAQREHQAELAAIEAKALQSVADEAGAPRMAEEMYAKAMREIKIGDGHAAAKVYEEAIKAYRRAKNLFETAEAEARTAIEAHGAIQRSVAEMHNARAHAEARNAITHALEEFQSAVKKQRAAESSTSPVVAVALFSAAKQLYLDAQFAAERELVRIEEQKVVDRRRRSQGRRRMLVVAVIVVAVAAAAGRVAYVYWEDFVPGASTTAGNGAQAPAAEVKQYKPVEFKEESPEDIEKALADFHESDTLDGLGDFGAGLPNTSWEKEHSEGSSATTPPNTTRRPIIQVPIPEKQPLPSMTRIPVTQPSSSYSSSSRSSSSYSGGGRR